MLADTQTKAIEIVATDLLRDSPAERLKAKSLSPMQSAICLAARSPNPAKKCRQRQGLDSADSRFRDCFRNVRVLAIAAWIAGDVLSLLRRPFFSNCWSKLARAGQWQLTKRRGEKLSLEQIRAFLEGSEEVRFEGHGRQEVYDWITRLLREHSCRKQGKVVRGLLRRYVAKMTGRSRAQVTRLVGRYLEHSEVKEAVYRQPIGERRKPQPEGKPGYLRVVECCVQRARERGIRELFAVTSQTSFFGRLGFATFRREKTAMFYELTPGT